MRAPILCVFGTRPEAIKLAPLILGLQGHPRLRPVVVSTGQHGALLDAVLGDFGLHADIDLALMRPGQSPAQIVAAALPRLGSVIAARAPVAVVVQGDTASAYAGALAAGYARVPLAHVEAGLRTGDNGQPFPEEFHRRAIAPWASLHFAPTPAARDALLREGVEPATIHLTGNSGIDALRLVEARLAHDPELGRSIAATLPRLDPERLLLLVTVHRRENHGAPLDRIIAALRLISDAAPAEIVVTVHPNPAVTAALRSGLAGLANVHLIPPLGYPAFVWLMSRAAMVLTDSGGVQEEAPALGVPVLVLRHRTEREEGIDTGNARLIGTATTAIVEAVLELLGNAPGLARMADTALPYGDGLSTPRILGVLDRLFGSAAARTELEHQL